MSQKPTTPQTPEEHGKRAREHHARRNLHKLTSKKAIDGDVLQDSRLKGPPDIVGDSPEVSKGDVMMKPFVGAPGLIDYFYPYEDLEK